MSEGASASVKLDAQGRIAEDLACIGCGYNLRTANPRGRCPECGTATPRTLWVARLRFCDPRWLRRIAKGGGYLIVGLATVLLGLLPLTFVQLPPILLLAAVIAVGAVTFLIGCFLITTHDPGQKPLSAFNILATLARAAMIIGIVGTLIAIAARRPTSPVDTENLAISSLWIGAIGVLGALAYTFQIVLRVQHPVLPWIIRGFGWVLSLTLLLLAVQSILMEYMAELSSYFNMMGWRTAGFYLELAYDYLHYDYPSAPWWMLLVLAILLEPLLVWFVIRVRDAGKRL